MLRTVKILRWIAAAACLGFPPDGLLALSPDEEFFESKIRPLLVEHCYECHSDEHQVKGGLRLDLKAGWETGGDSGPAIIPGEPDNSLLVRAIRYDDEDLQMPPPKKGRLEETQVEWIVEWVRRGAPDPRTGELERHQPGEDHWAFQPVSNPSIPTVQDEAWVNNPVDPFVLSQLESANLKPSHRAAPRTLVRRVFHDVIGLPPTPQEVSAFEQDASQEAYEALVNDLLSRPQYGEKWARHWMDVARYADTKGYVFQEERAYAYAYTFRDYLIESFNDDKPFDRFVMEQLAADQLDLGEDRRPLAGMGYLTLGRRFLNNQHDIIDDRIDVVTRGMMGLTVTCARCHDHKYDPIPAADYYSLYGVFASSHEPGEKPLIGVEPPGYEAYLQEKRKREKERDDFVAETNHSIREKLRSSVGDYLLAAHEAGLLEDRDAREKLAKSRQLDFGVQERWADALEKWNAEANGVFLVWNSIRAGITNADLNIEDRLVTARADAPAPLRTAMEEGSPKTLKELAEIYGSVFRAVDESQPAPAQPREGAPEEPQPDPSWDTFREILHGKGMPLDIPDGDLRRMYEVKEGERARALQRAVEKLDATHEGAPPRAMAMYDNDKPFDAYVFKRGQPGNRGDSVPRQFLGVLSKDRRPFEQGSGRLELARAIASTENPLTARVLVNRVWLQYFNSPLVGTPSDFGVRSDPPTNPELLDHLAWTFMHEDQWSLKQLHRRILLSATYQQASTDDPDRRAVDPDNRLYWRQNRKRLGFEAMRDSLLAVAGNLDARVGGRSVDIDGADYSPRRSLYGHIDRQNLPAMFRTFDLASPDTTSPKRFTTTVPQQALFLMNSPFIIRQSRELAASLENDVAQQTDALIREVYLRLLQREPTATELDLARTFLRRERERPVTLPEPPLWQYGFGTIDPDAGRITSFHPFPTYKDSQWQVSQTVPDPEHGWALLTQTGGHPGNDLDHAVIRRWTAPRDGTITVDGEARHPSDQGDGVRLWITRNQAGRAEQWIVQNQSVQTTSAPMDVKKGDQIDLVVDCRTSPNHDSFTWVATIRFQGEEKRERWNTSRQFSGPQETIPPLEPVEKLAQVLLVSNEFFFID